LIHLVGPRINAEDIQNEARAIKKLCGSGSHINIVEVTRLGELPHSHYYFVDMELCALTLENYIYGTSTGQVRGSLTPELSLPRFIQDAPASIKSLQIWNIMRQIASGVKFIHSHGEVHRDLKPSNGIILNEFTNYFLVLYSRKDSSWKLADFGLTSEGTSNRHHVTKDARGTPSYRAPELLQEDAGSYNNKVDIWAVGCILYELAARKKVFSGDWAVLDYSRSAAKLDVHLDETYEASFVQCLNQHVHDMLQIVPSARPSALRLLEEFDKLCEISDRDEPRDLQVHHNFNVVTREGV
jgi:serine/threonine protein kinase